jgi:hypothetical protein
MIWCVRESSASVQLWPRTQDRLRNGSLLGVSQLLVRLLHRRADSLRIIELVRTAAVHPFKEQTRLEFSEIL